MSAALHLVHNGDGGGELPPLAAWEIHMRGAGRSERTITGTLNTIDHMCRFTGKTINTLTPLDVSRYLGRPNLKPWSRAAYFASIAAFYRWYGENGGIDVTRRLPRPKMPQSIPRPISDEQLRDLMDTRMHYRTRVMIMLAALAGLRVHEIAKVRAEDIDLRGRTLRVTGKGGVTATLPLHPLLVEAATGMPRRGWWFPGNSRRIDQPILPRSVADIISMAMDRAGIPDGSAHRLRHWYGSTLVADGTDLRTAQKLLRHANLNTTAIYVAVRDEKRVEAIDRLALPLPPNPAKQDQADREIEQCRQSILRALGALESGQQMSRTQLSRALRSTVRRHIDIAIDDLAAAGTVVIVAGANGRSYRLTED